MLGIVDLRLVHKRQTDCGVRGGGGPSPERCEAFALANPVALRPIQENTAAVHSLQQATRGVYRNVQKEIITMKLLMWAGTGLVALLWTLMIAIMASLASWLAVSADQAVGGLQAISQWPVPPWLALWVDPALLESIKPMVVWGLDLLVNALPWLTPFLGWVSPLLWVVWAVVMLLLLAIAAGGHLLVGRLRPATRTRL